MPERDVFAALEGLAEVIRTYVPSGFRDEDGVWHDGPIRAQALADLRLLHSALGESSNS